MNDHITPSSLLYTSPSLWKGFARLADLYGELDEFNTSPEADKEALRHDWEIVGEDLKKVMTEHEPQKQNS